MKSSDDLLIRLIAIFKLVKAALLVAVGVGTLKLLHQDVGDTLQRWVEALKLDPGNHLIDAALGKMANLDPHQIKRLGIGSFIYAGLFWVEGIGLWLRKPWAEWLTVIITGSLVPIEIYEIHRHFTPIKVVVLILNVAIVIYLIYRIRSRGSASR